MSGTLVLDSEGLSRYLRGDRTVTARLEAARLDDMRVVVSAVTIVEADPQGANRARVSWALSRLAVEPVTKELATAAVALLAEIDSSGGHKYALDALVAATARAAHPPVVVLTSDPEDLERLCGPRVAVLKT
ncbi:DNA-binding protein [Streptomyces sp. Je 1-79]|uniref:PIN domain-containing protein n=1 Tax=Streptomyces sp. Je 1-79 TaxID=2943847 RepID=UPI0021A9314F|nr:PIN domain-containing protein [Streptomyces sp. Je 1-79]MCT4356313.1 DNA-binding protein [Streptomyces sp. Je 1-79]